MPRLLRLVVKRALCVAIVCACVALAAPPSAWAQGDGGAGIAAAKARTEPSYVFPYFLIVLATGLGLMILGKPSRRKDPAEERSGPE